MKNEEYKYKISFSPKNLILSVIMLAVFGLITVWLYIKNNGAYLFTMIFCVLFIYVLVYTLYKMLFVKVLIGENSFYYQTAPWKGKTYEYSEISEAWISAEVSSSDTGHRYFNFKTPDGKTHNFSFYLYQSDETDYLLLKINGENEDK